MKKTIRTQDGRFIEIKNQDNAFIGCIRVNHHYSEVFCTFLDKKGKPLKYFGVIGKFFDEFKAKEIRESLVDFLNDELKDYFSVPIDLSKDWLTITEKICENHRLTMATVEEASLYFKDKREARRLAEETDYFEKRNVIIYDEKGFFKSFNKWKQIQVNRAD